MKLAEPQAVPRPEPKMVTLFKCDLEMFYDKITRLEAQLRDAERKLTRVSELMCDSCRINVGMQMDGALRGENAELKVRLAEAERRLEAMQKLVDEQAEDEGLWFNAVHVSEAYLQKAVRRLHAVIEGEES